MKKLLLSFLMLLPLIAHAAGHSHYLRELNNMCPFEYKIGQMIRVAESDGTITITYRQSDSQSLNAIKRLNAGATTQNLLKDYLALGFLELFEGNLQFYQSFLGVNKMVFKVENNRSQPICIIPVERVRYFSDCYHAAKDGSLPPHNLSITNLRFYTLFENTAGPYELVAGYKRTKVDYDEQKKVLKIFCVLDEARVGATLPGRVTPKEIESVKDMWFGPTSAFMGSIYYSTIKYLEQIGGSFVVKIRGSKSNNQIIVDLPPNELKTYALNYRLAMMR